MGRLTKEDKVLRADRGQLVIHYDCESPFLDTLVDALVAACVGKKISMSHAWTIDSTTERLIIQLPQEEANAEESPRRAR